MTVKSARVKRQPQSRYCHIAPFGRDCFYCGHWLTNEHDLLREDKRPVYNDYWLPIRIQTYMVYQCPECGHLMRNPRVYIYD